VRPRLSCISRFVLSCEIPVSCWPVRRACRAEAKRRRIATPASDFFYFFWPKFTVDHRISSEIIVDHRGCDRQNYPARGITERGAV
jgi:hypothetical protein